MCEIVDQVEYFFVMLVQGCVNCVVNHIFSAATNYIYIQKESFRLFS